MRFLSDSTFLFAAQMGMSENIGDTTFSWANWIKLGKLMLTHATLGFPHFHTNHANVAQPAWPHHLPRNMPMMAIMASRPLAS
jgi:hypothetical protein